MRFIEVSIIAICLMAVSFSTAQGSGNMGFEPSTPSEQQGINQQEQWLGGTVDPFLNGESEASQRIVGRQGYTSPEGVLVIGTTLNSPPAGDTWDNPTLPTASSLALAQQIINNARLLQQELIDKSNAYQNGQISYEQYSDYLKTAKKRADAIRSEVNNLENAIGNAINEAGGLNLNVPSYPGSKGPIPIIGGEG